VIFVLVPPCSNNLTFRLIPPSGVSSSFSQLLLNGFSSFVGSYEMPFFICQEAVSAVKEIKPATVLPRGYIKQSQQFQITQSASCVAATK